jgi:hypothetical protein
MKTIFNTKILAAGIMAMSLGLAGCLTDSKDDMKEPDVVTTPWTADSVLAVGAQGHASLGTAIDLDLRRVMLSSVVNDTANGRANLRSVDVLFAFDTVSSTFKIMSPVAAKAANISVARNYIDSLITDTKHVKVSAAPANYEAAVAAFNAGTQSSATTVVANDMFVVKTNLNEYAFLTVSSITGTDRFGAGTITVNLKQVAAPVMPM